MNKIKGLVVGEYGIAHTLQAVDDAGAALDLSTYTAVIVRSVSPSAQTTLQFTGAFVSSTGGTFSFTPDTGATFTEDGEWESQAQFSDAGILALTIPFILEVEKQI